jgi:predicted dehydrogenase
MKRLRVGIIGQGRSGFGIHTHSLELMADKFEIAAVCDPLIDRCNDAAEKFGSKAYADYHEMLKNEKLDLVVNASPSNFHVPITLEIMDAGFNVLCEKPLARKVSDVDALIAKSKETGKLFAIYQQSRFAPYFLQVRKVIDSGVLGRIVMIKIAFNGFDRRYDWQTVQEYNGGSLLNTGPHPLDQALQLFGTDVMPNVLCLMDRVNTYGDAEDHVKLMLSGHGRPTIDLEISSCSAYPQHTYEIYAENGGLAGNMTHIDWKYFKPEEAPRHELSREPLPGRSYCSDDLKWYEESWDVPKEESTMFEVMAGRLYDTVYNAIVDGKPLVVTPEQVRRQIQVIEECHKQNPLSRLG